MNHNFKVGDTVKVNYGKINGEATIIGDVTDLYGQYSVSRVYIVSLEDNISNGEISDIVLNSAFLTKIEPKYLDEVQFQYPDFGGHGEQGNRHVMVLKECDKYIEGHKFGTTDYRKYSKSKIIGKIFRA